MAGGTVMTKTGIGALEGFRKKNSSATWSKKMTTVMSHALCVLGTLRERLCAEDYNMCLVLFGVVRKYPVDMDRRLITMNQLLHIVSTDRIAYGELCDYLSEHEPYFIVTDATLERLLDAAAL